MPDCEAETPFFGLVYGFLHYFFVIFLHNDSWFERQMPSSSLERSNPVYLHFEAPRYVICRAIMSSLMNVILYLFHFPLIKIKVVSLLDWIFVHEFCCRHAAFSFLFFSLLFLFCSWLSPASVFYLKKLVADEVQLSDAKDLAGLTKIFTRNATYNIGGPIIHGIYNI